MCPKGTRRMYHLAMSKLVIVIFSALKDTYTTQITKSKSDCWNSQMKW